MVKIFSSQPFYSKYIQQPSDDQSSHPLYHNKKLWPFFQHALGAIDGSHIHFSPPAFSQAAYRNRKGFLSQNCLFACNFNFMFTYALTGWEGSAADAWVYHDAVNTDLVIPEGSYYLGDAGFPHCDQLLVLFGVSDTILQNGDDPQHGDRLDLFPYTKTPPFFGF